MMIITQVLSEKLNLRGFLHTKQYSYTIIQNTVFSGHWSILKLQFYIIPFPGRKVDSRGTTLIHSTSLIG